MKKIKKLSDTELCLELVIYLLKVVKIIPFPLKMQIKEDWDKMVEYQDEFYNRLRLKKEVQE